MPTDKGANAGAKVTALVAGMVAGADSLDDMALLRHGGMRRLFDRCYAPSTLGSFLRTFTFGHVRQLDAVASRLLTELAAATPLTSWVGEVAVVDIDDTIVEVHGYAKQGAGFGYSKVRGLNTLIATVSTQSCAPVIVAQRLRKGSANSARGAQRLVRDALKTVRTLRQQEGAGTSGRVLLRADSAYYGHAVIGAAVKAGAEVSVTVRLDTRVKAAIGSIGEDAWTTIEYPRAVFDQDSGVWISSAQVAEVPYTAFTSKKKSEQVTGRLVVRRIPDANAEKKKRAGQDGLFELWRHHAFFTTTPAETADTVAADKVHRAHAIIEQVHADLKNSALAHLPSKSFAANSAWLVLAVMAFNLTRAAATLTGQRRLARATTATVRHALVHVPARVATSARRIVLHLPRAWPWEHAWHRLFANVNSPPQPSLT